MDEVYFNRLIYYYENIVCVFQHNNTVFIVMLIERTRRRSNRKYFISATHANRTDRVRVRLYSNWCFFSHLLFFSLLLQFWYASVTSSVRICLSRVDTNWFIWFLKYLMHVVPFFFLSICFSISLFLLTAAFHHVEVRQEAVQQALAALKNRPKPSLPMPSKRSSVLNRSPDRNRDDSGNTETVKKNTFFCAYSHLIRLSFECGEQVFINWNQKQI